MEIKIGIIGPCDVVQAVMDVGQEFVGVLLEPLIYRNEEEAPQSAEDFNERGRDYFYRPHPASFGKKSLTQNTLPVRSQYQ